MLESPGQHGEPLIYPAHGDSENIIRSHLILYGVSEGQRQKQLVLGRIKSQLNISKLSENTEISVTVNPIFLYQSPEFFRIVSHSLEVILDIARKKSRPASVVRSYVPE
jgi:hypothetical protein